MPKRKRRGATNRYFKNVHRDRERIAAEERRARGERTELEQFADDLVQRVRGNGTATKPER
ncbi:MAG TPA: hypothetical protein VF009_07055 [Solirubrobacterales bacterium]